MVRQGLALRRRSLYDRLRAIAGYDYTRRPDATLILTPSVWEERLTTRFCINLNLDDCYVAVESRNALERRDLRLWHKHSWVGSTYRTLEDVSAHGSPGGRRSIASPERKRASLPRPERMARAAPAFGVSPSEKRTLELITDHPMIPREHLAGQADQDGRPSGAARAAIDLSVVRGVGSSKVVPGSVGSYRPVIAGAKLREGTTTILPRGRALQGVGLSSMRFHPTGGGPKTTKMDKKHGSRQESHPILDRPEIDWPCRT